MELKKKEIIKICRNSQGPLTGKRGDACVKKKGPHDKGRKLIALSAVTSGVTTPC